ncbi:ADP-ribosylglycohydrolase [Thermanaeromonas toyohensis ToBE]|uniref:ADP-ribosylglycohydrolase n=1 Tax=Thermanaeromonas toyohensis ToBE TaxID=698762 RepID=A0A1W1V936_9FIRM|nr:ADP-ribosylglycohydrolase family protein [Thermanaeromonas toyohensis]SMB89828.1 ADP-ribosylglycohydrolase [Thermanaeromonas toyohensis ToBE]
MLKQYFTVELEKYLGCLWGLALGDAMGMPTEFLTPEEIASRFGGKVQELREPLVSHPRAGCPAGAVTDDTGQAIALAKALITYQRLTPELVANALVQWAIEVDAFGKGFLGPSTAYALKALQKGATPAEAGRQGKTNGGAVRIAPVALVFSDNWQLLMEQTAIACLPTHGTTLAISAAAAVSAAIAAALVPGASVEDVLKAARLGAVAGRDYGYPCWTPLLERRLDLALEIISRYAERADQIRALYELIGVDMTVTESVITALALVAVTGGEPMPAIIEAVNMGGDTDTIAAIAGAICGALRGSRAFDVTLVSQVERVNSLDCKKLAIELLELRKTYMQRYSF